MELMGKSLIEKLAHKITKKERHCLKPVVLLQKLEELMKNLPEEIAGVPHLIESENGKREYQRME